MNKNIATLLAALLLTLAACASQKQEPTQQPSQPRGLLSQSVDTPAPAVQVNGQSVTGGVTLKPGDTITIKVPDAPVAVTPPKPVPPVVVTPAGSWIRAASDGGSFILNAQAKVRYGVEPSWLIRDAPAGTYYCNDGGGDPAVGQAKFCEVFVPEGQASPVAPTSQADPAPAAKPFDPPLTITRGGTYTGRWQSADPGIPAVSVKTSEPVTLENCAVSGPGHLIAALWVNARLTVRGCEGTDTSDATAGRFVAAEGVHSLVVTGNTLRGTAGIYLHQVNPDPANKIEIIGNRAYDITGKNTNGKDLVQFVQFNKVRDQAATIAWNRVENSPYRSSVEDVINLYNTTGKPGSPVSVRNNLLIGAYGTPPDSVYSGGGIMLGDGDGANLEAVDNTVIEVSNYGIARAGGSNITIQGNTVLGLGKLADGTILDGDPDAGIYSRNYSGKVFDAATVKIMDNVVGWGRPLAANLRRTWNYSLSGTMTGGNKEVVPTADLIAQAVAKWDAAYAAR
ncbi:hypothetical protein [Deinococcus arenicola]|uniref:Right-handed parallel beta-helix repeat-containing protein n=1 Tax=Deinococcus arenicola TaxID=2994950 RepID=A0ABU4DWI1_9DEIO|nr:hypothetical protein [Deinococcus sp. ZS9-10]MDV6376024.1 right-handed parallel beta-helix repeat-containing protein [Deinococcus sp. ZS9-10]